jgi:hypothetical protein
MYVCLYPLAMSGDLMTSYRETSGDGTRMPEIHRDDGLVPVSPPESLFPVASGLVNFDKLAIGLAIAVGIAIFVARCSNN